MVVSHMLGGAFNIERGDSHIEPGRLNFKECKMIQMNPLKN